MTQNIRYKNDTKIYKINNINIKMANLEMGHAENERGKEN